MSYNNPFWKRIDHVYDQFQRFLRWTKGKENVKARSKFPKSESISFLDRLTILYGEIATISKQSCNEATDKLQNYTRSLQIVIKGLTGRDGIEAFVILLETSHDLMQQLALHIEIAEHLQLENSNLRSRIDELEQTVTEIQQKDGTRADTPVKFSEKYGKDSSENDSDLPEMLQQDATIADFTFNLAVLKDAISFASNSDIHVLDAYAAEELTSRRRRIIVLYDGKYDAILPPPSEYIFWRNIKDDVAFSRLSIINWQNFLNSAPGNASHLISQFHDANITSWFSRMSDLVALMPGAMEIDGNLEPVIEVLKRCVGYCTDGIEEIPSITLSTGVELRLRYRNGYLTKMNNVDLGYGISMKGAGENFGTIGGFVRAKDPTYKDKIGVLTCEHVVEAGKAMAEKDPLASTNTTFVFPGRGARAARIISQFNKDNKNLKLLDCLLSNCSNSLLKELLGTPSTSDITLIDVKKYLEKAQFEITVPNHDIVACTSYLSPLSSKFGDTSIDIVGDVAAVFIPATELCGLTITNKIDNLQPEPLTLSSMYDMFNNSDRKIITVFKKGGNDFTAQRGWICRPTNLAFPFAKNRFLLDQKPSQYLKEYAKNQNGEEVKVILKTMYIINSDQSFGVGGDSGALVHAFNDNKSKCFAIGTFLGSVDSCNYIATPIDVVTDMFDFIEEI